MTTNLQSSVHPKRSIGDSEPPDTFQQQSTGYLRTRGQETYETHGQPFSVSSEESLRDSEPPDIFFWVPEHQGTGDFMRSECMKLVLVSFTLASLHTLSVACALVLSSYIIMFARGTCAS